MQFGSMMMHAPGDDAPDDRQSVLDCDISRIYDTYTMRNMTGGDDG